MMITENLIKLVKKIWDISRGEGVGDLENCEHLWKNPGYAPA